MTGKRMKSTIRILAALLALAGFSHGAQARNCLGLGDVYYNDPSGKCYYVETTPANFATAQAACMANGGYLAHVNNATENSLITTQLSGQGNVMIGARDAANNDRWVWDEGDLKGQTFWIGNQTGAAANSMYTNWSVGNPNSSTQDCAHLNTSGAGAWDDLDCTAATNPYLCELYACQNPLGDQGEVIFNEDARTLQYCNGGTWVAMAQPSYVPTAVTFDGTNDYMTTASAQGADSQRITGSVWIKYSSNTAPYTLMGQSGVGAMRISYSGGSGNRFDIIARRGSDSTIVFQARCGTWPSVGTWYHYVFSVDLSDVNKRHCYVNDVSSYTNLTYLVGETMNFDIASTRIGANNDGPASNKFNGSIADLWLDFGTYIDLSVAANRRKFIDATGRPVDLGSNGGRPTGSQPEIYLSGAIGAWHTNKGASTGYTLTGALTADTPPGTLDAVYFEAGLVGYWTLDDVSGSTAVESTGGFNGTYQNGPTAISGQVGLGRNFAVASSQRVTVPHNTRYNVPDYTLAAWVFATTPSDGVEIDNSSKIIDKDRDFTMNWDHEGIGGVSCEHHDGGTWVNTAGTAPPPLAAGQWYHIACTYDDDGNGYVLYVNGIAVNSRAGIAPPQTDTDNISIGSLFTGTSDFFDGRIDDVRVYNRALSAAEIDALYDWGSAGGSLCQNPARPPGTIIYNDVSNVPQFCDGSLWRALGPVPGPGGAGCSSPARGEGHILFNSATRTMQYCDGVTWRAMPGMGLSAPTAGLVHHWSFDDATGTAIDDSVGGNDCTGDTLTSVSGKFGSALQFDDNEHAYCGSHTTLNGATQYTISAWMKRGQLSDSLWFRNSNDGAVGLVFELSNISNYFVHSNNNPTVGGVDYNDSFFTLADTNWHLITAVFDGSLSGDSNRMKIYVDGVPQALSFFNSVPASATGGDIPLEFGYFNSSTVGTIDDVRIYNRALSAAEVSQLYYATGGN